MELKTIIALVSKVQQCGDCRFSQQNLVADRQEGCLSIYSVFRSDIALIRNLEINEFHKSLALLIKIIIVTRDNNYSENN